MNNDKLAVNKRLALKMFWDAGFTSESDMLLANKTIMAIDQPSEGYWYAEDIVDAINYLLGR